ncbi:MAG: WhiB family transcriptional regulator [Actinomycetota bacterium]
MSHETSIVIDPNFIITGQAPKAADPDWREKGLCTDLPIQEVDRLFFGTKFTDEAKQYCDRCPVQADCDIFAGSWSRTEGVWAGREH